MRYYEKFHKKHGIHDPLNQLKMRYKQKLKTHTKSKNIYIFIICNKKNMK